MEKTAPIRIEVTAEDIATASPECPISVAARRAFGCRAFRSSFKLFVLLPTPEHIQLYFLPESAIGFYCRRASRLAVEPFSFDLLPIRH